MTPEEERQGKDTLVLDDFYIHSLDARGVHYQLVGFCFVFVEVEGFKTGIPCIFGACPETHSVDQTGPQLTDVHLPLSPKCWF